MQNKFDPYKVFELALIKIGLPEFKREYKFHPDRKWRIDFCWPKEKLAVEIEGGTWTSHSRHTKGKGFLGDLEKYNSLVMYGYALLRFTPEQCQNGIALSMIEKWFKLNKIEYNKPVFLLPLNCNICRWKKGRMNPAHGKILPGVGKCTNPSGYCTSLENLKEKL